MAPIIYLLDSPPCVHAPNIQKAAGLCFKGLTGKWERGENLSWSYSNLLLSLIWKVRCSQSPWLTPAICWASLQSCTSVFSSAELNCQTLMAMMFPAQPNLLKVGFSRGILGFFLGESCSLHVQPQCDLSAVQETSRALSLVSLELSAKNVCLDLSCWDPKRGWSLSKPPEWFLHILWRMLPSSTHSSVGLILQELTGAKETTLWQCFQKGKLLNCQQQRTPHTGWTWNTNKSLPRLWTSWEVPLPPKKHRIILLFHTFRFCFWSLLSSQHM